MTPDQLRDLACQLDRHAHQALKKRRNEESDWMSRWFEGRADGLRSAATLLRVLAKQEMESASYAD